MSVLGDLARRHSDLSAAEVEHLHRLLGDWQLLADLNFADLLLFAERRGGEGFVVLAQVRPYPAQTLYQEDMVGYVVERRPRVSVAFAEQRIVREGDPEWREGTPIREEAIPVVFKKKVVAVISSEQNLAAARTPSKLELSYLQAAGDLAQMIAEGTFPGHDPPERDIRPRVGDGFLRLDPKGVIEYASPNAVSAYRRLGVTVNMIDQSIGDLGLDGEAEILPDLRKARAIEGEIEAEGAWVIRRFIPVVHGGTFGGVLGIVRDITELRSRDRMLILKDATIREIHHRVKNNLQTVASLLRLQSRRLGSAEAKEALEESVRRIASIALVHETLSQDSHERVEFDHVAHRILEMLQEGLAPSDRPIRLSLEGSSGELPSDIATALALILVELCQNAVEHAFPARGGTVTVGLKRSGASLDVAVSDNGVGLPEEFSLETGANLGLQIVRTLVIAELRGELSVEVTGGTTIRISVPLAR
jgi:two-component sensor histidine kinase